VSKVLAVKGKVLPVSLQDIQIGARLHDRSVIVGETEIGHRLATPDNAIEEIFMEPASAAALPEAIEALQQADVIVIGPGSLYTSIIPNLLFEEICHAIFVSRAVKVHICNIMTQPAETLGYDAARHLGAILQHARRDNARGFIDYVIVNNAWIDNRLIARYQLESAVPSWLTANRSSRWGPKWSKHNWRASAAVLFAMIIRFWPGLSFVWRWSTLPANHDRQETDIFPPSQG
jgi:uncharacterized cofD-like protein